MGALPVLPAEGFRLRACLESARGSCCTRKPKGNRQFLGVAQKKRHLLRTGLFKEKSKGTAQKGRRFLQIKDQSGPLAQSFCGVSEEHEIQNGRHLL